MEIGEIFTFMMTFTLLESLAVTGFLLLLGVALPSNWLKEGFSIKGLLFIVIFAIASILFQKLMPDDFPSMVWLLLGSVIPLVLIVFLSFFINAHPRIRDVLLNIQDRISIMLYVYIPLGVISLTVFLYRNLL